MVQPLGRRDEHAGLPLSVWVSVAVLAERKRAAFAALSTLPSARHREHSVWPAPCLVRPVPSNDRERWAEGGMRASGPGLLRGRRRRSTPATAKGRHGPRSTEIARLSARRTLPLWRGGGRATTVHAHTVRVDHVSLTPIETIARLGDAVDHSDRVRRLVNRPEGDRAVSLVHRACGSIGAAAPFERA